MSFATHTPRTQSIVVPRIIATWTITELWSNETSIVNEYHNDHDADLICRLFFACNEIMKTTHNGELHATDLVHMTRQWTHDSFAAGCATYTRTEVTE
jgi:hypothetical protein